MGRDRDTRPHSRGTICPSVAKHLPRTEGAGSAARFRLDPVANDPQRTSIAKERMTGSRYVEVASVHVVHVVLVVKCMRTAPSATSVQCFRIPESLKPLAVGPGDCWSGQLRGRGHFASSRKARNANDGIECASFDICHSTHGKEGAQNCRKQI
jgi:hypothetical protein